MRQALNRQVTDALGDTRFKTYMVLQAAIAALLADAQTADETDWVQIVEWYDELVRLTDSPVVRLNRAVAVGEADGPQAGLRRARRTRPDAPAVHRFGRLPPRAGRRRRHGGAALG